MKTLVLPDIHHKVVRAQRIIDLEAADRVVHLGDHQDNYNDSPDDARQTALWTRERLAAGDEIIIGNHDLPYYYHTDYSNWRCGWGPLKHRAVRETLSQGSIRMMRLWVWVDGWLCSHAGITSSYLQGLPCGTWSCTPAYQEHFLDLLAAGLPVPLVHDVGRRRGGDLAHGGLLWEDFRDLHGTPGLKQLVGHTQAPDVRERYWPDRGAEVCIDTGLRHYAIIKDGELVIREI